MFDILFKMSINEYLQAKKEMEQLLESELSIEDKFYSLSILISILLYLKDKSKIDKVKEEYDELKNKLKSSKSKTDSVPTLQFNIESFKLNLDLPSIKDLKYLK